MGAVDQEPRRRSPDAALAHRQDHRHPALPERSVAERRADRHHRALGRCRRAEGRPEGHAAAGEVGGRQRLELRRALRRPARSRSSSRRPTRRRRWPRTRGSSRSCRPASPRRAGSAPSKSGPSTVKGRKITHHALARLQQTENGNDEPSARRRDRRRSGPGPLHGVGRRQAGRNHAAELRQADAARFEDRVGHPLLRRRARTSPIRSSSASTSIRRARSRSIARRSRSSAASPAAIAASTSSRTRSTSAPTST